MNENTIAGSAKAKVGEMESDMGHIIGDSDMKLDGAKRQLEGQSQHLIGKVQDSLNGAASGIADTTAKVSQKAKTAVDQAALRARQVDDQVKPFVTDQPYTALGLAAATGLLLGLLIAGRGPKIIYVTPRA